MQYPYIVGPKSITIYADGAPHVLSSDHANFNEVLNAVKGGDFDEALRLIDLSYAITQWGDGCIVVSDGSIYFGDEEIHNALTQRILNMMREGFDVQPFLLFLENLLQNPSRTAIEELYLFLEATDLPITPDGHFLAYKAVRQDYHSVHVGKGGHNPRNAVGDVVEMERRDVDDRRDVTCSHGLHFASLDYASSFHGNGRIMVLKINPRDVVSIPSDYGNQKGRCCRYEVVAETSASMVSSVVDYRTLTAA